MLIDIYFTGQIIGQISCHVTGAQKHNLLGFAVGRLIKKYCFQKLRYFCLFYCKYAVTTRVLKIFLLGAA